MRARALACLIAAFGVGCKSVPASAPEPETRAQEPVSSDPQITTLLERACFQCHAPGASVPWSAAFSPSYWFASPARKALDFSAWPAYDAQHRSDELRAIAKLVRGGQMPPWDYTAFDSNARLTPDEQEIVADWADQASAPRAR